MPVIDRMYATLGDSDARTIVCVAANESITRRIIGDAAERWLTFCDPDQKLATALGLERLPAFVHLRQDTSLVAAAQGWSVSEWQRVADELAKKEHWTSPRISAPGNPRRRRDGHSARNGLVTHLASQQQREVTLGYLGGYLTTRIPGKTRRCGGSLVSGESASAIASVLDRRADNC